MRTSRLFWLGSVAFAVGAAALVALLVQRYQHSERVVVARVAIAPWSLVTAGDLTVSRRPVAGQLPGTLLTPTLAVGRFATTGLLPGQAVTVANLSGAGLGSAYDAQLAALDGITERCTSNAPAVPAPASAAPRHALARCGPYVALPLPLTADQGYDLIHAGSRVDLWATYPTPSGEMSQDVGSGILVMARLTPGAGAPIVGSTAPAAPSSTGDSGIVVLAVTPADAGRILLAGKLGTLTVVLEPVGGHAQAAPLPVNMTGLLGGTPPLTAPPAQAGSLPLTPAAATGKGT